MLLNHHMGAHTIFGEVEAPAAATGNLEGWWKKKTSKTSEIKKLGVLR